MKDFSRTLNRCLLMAVAALVPLLLIACAPEAKETDVIATVNGRPILLSSLEANYNLEQLGWTGGASPSVDRLRQDYDRILTELIVRELIYEELEKRGLSVTQQELDKAEAEVRSDYPEGGFEEILVEEYIDLQNWRAQLRARLAQQKFLREILRAGVTIDYEEAKAYYAENISDFYLPPRLRFLMVSGPDKEVVEKAAAMFVAGESAESVHEQYSQLQVQNLKMRQDRLPSAWSSILKELAPGTAAKPYKAEQGGFETLVLTERIPGKVLDPSHAYPLVEKVLLERKLQEAFEAWMSSRLESSTINVSSHLLPNHDDTDSASSSDTQQSASEPLPEDDTLRGDPPGKAPESAAEEGARQDGATP